MADKNSGGLVDYEEFAERFSGSSGSVPRSIPGVLPAPAEAAEGGDAPEIQAVSARTDAIMDSHAFQADRLPALLGLWEQAWIFQHWLV